MKYRYRPGIQVGSSKCDVCKKVFSTNIGLWDHCRVVHNITDMPRPKEDDWMGPGGLEADDE